MLKGRVIYQSKAGGVFVQIDKNFQICDFLSFDKTKPFEERIGQRVHPELLNTFRGRPLRLVWSSLINILGRKGN